MRFIDTVGTSTCGVSSSVDPNHDGCILWLEGKRNPMFFVGLHDMECRQKKNLIGYTYTMCVVLIVIRTVMLVSSEKNCNRFKKGGGSTVSAVCSTCLLTTVLFRTNQQFLRSNIFPRNNTNSSYKDYTHGVRDKILPGGGGGGGQLPYWACAIFEDPQIQP